MTFELTLDDLHTLATSLGYTIQNLQAEIDRHEPGSPVALYKCICCKDAERLLRNFSEEIVMQREGVQFLD